MEEFLEEAVEEIKRAEHLIYVSLKYTRTVDVFKSIFERLINSFDFIIIGLLKKLLKEKKIKGMPSSIKARCDVLKEIYASDEAFVDYINLYALMRKFNKAEYTRKNEFRRHVTMIVTIDNNQIVDVTIDTISENFAKTKAFLEHVKEMLGEGESDS